MQFQRTQKHTKRTRKKDMYNSKLESAYTKEIRADKKHMIAVR